MKPPGLPDLFDLLVATPCLSSNGSRELSYPEGMAGEPGVLRFAHLYQCLERSHGQSFHLGALAREVRRKPHDFFLEDSGSAALLHELGAAAERPLHRCLQLGEVERLGEIIHGAVLEIANGVTDIGNGTEY